MGRPYGTKAALLASHKTLRHTHFSYVRFAIEGLSLRDAWLRCLAYAGGSDDQRHFQHLLQRIGAQIRVGAVAHDLAGMAETALGPLMARQRPPAAPAALAPTTEFTTALAPLGAPVGSPGAEGRAGQASTPASQSTSLPAAATEVSAAALPSLDEWVAQRCAELGIDPDFQRQSDWLVEYQETFDLDLHPVERTVGQPGAAATPAARSATADRDEPSARSRSAVGGAGAPDSAHAVTPDRVPGQAPVVQPTLTEQLTALNTLAVMLVVPPGLDDALEAWLAPALPCACVCERWAWPPSATWPTSSTCTAIAGTRAYRGSARCGRSAWWNGWRRSWRTWAGRCATWRCSRPGSSRWRASGNWPRLIREA